MICAAIPTNDDLPAWLTENRRSHLRSRTIYCHGKLKVSGAEQICQVRNISQSGISLDLRTPPQPGQRVEIEMRGMAPTPAIVAWREASCCGLAFEAEQDLDAIFAKRRELSGKQARGPRFALGMPASFAAREGAWPIEILDISVGGLKMRGNVAADVGSHGVVRMGAAAEDIYGLVCWKRGDAAGLRFDQTIAREDLFNILSAHG